MEGQRKPIFGRVFVRLQAAALLGVAGMLVPNVASASSTPLTVNLAAEVAPRCGFGGGGVRGANGADLERKGQVSLRVRLDCNTPYAVGVVAQTGLLSNIDAAPDQSGYAFSKAYSLTLRLDTDKGLRISSPCSSTQLVAGGNCPFAATMPGTGFSSLDGISVDRDLIISVDWPDQTRLGSRLAPGRYRDTVVIVIGARA